MSEITKKINKQKKDNYSIVDMKPIRNDSRISWQAKGILIYLLDRPDDWEPQKQDLINRSKNGKQSVTTALKELKSAGYLAIEKNRGEKGQFTEIIWHLSENPEEMPLQNRPHPESGMPDSGNPDYGEWGALLNTDVLSTKDTNLKQGLDSLNLSSTNIDELQARDLIKLFNFYMRELADEERTTTNWGKEGSIMKKLYTEHLDNPKQVNEFLQWTVTNKAEHFKNSRTSYSNLGALNKFIDEFKNWKKEKEKSEELEKQIDAGAPDPDESVNSMEDARNLMG